MFRNYQKPFRTDRSDDAYGGVIIYVKNNIPCKRRTDLEVDGVESVWLEMKLKNKTVLFATFYRAPNSTSEVQTKIESSLDLAYDTDASNIIITGDFNYNYLNTAGQRKATSLFEHMVWSNSLMSLPIILNLLNQLLTSCLLEMLPLFFFVVLAMLF